jgi:hypothetical protein
LDDGGFGGAIQSEPLVRRDCAPGGDVHDVSALLRSHLFQDGLTAQRRAPEVGPEDLLGRPFRHVRDTFAQADGGDVDQHIDAAEFAQHAFKHRVDVAALTQVGSDVDGVAAVFLFYLR